MTGKRLTGLLLLILGTACYGIALLFGQRAENGLGLIQVYLEQAVDSVQAEQIRNTEAETEAPIRFCFWGENGEETVSCPVNGAIAKGNVTLLAGYPALMGAEGLSWQNGCLLDGGTARALFGTERCGGQRILVNGNEYPALGTVSGPLSGILRLAEKEDGTVLNRCVLALPPVQAKVQGEAFLLRHGLPGRVLDNFPLWAVVGNLLLLFPGGLMLTLWSRLRKGWRGLTFEGVRTGQQGILLLKTILSFCLTVGSIWLLGRKLVIPGDMIPSRWSDFSFWGNWWQGQKENFTLLFSRAPGNGQLQMMGNMVKSMVASTTAFLLLLWAIGRADHENTAD